jgi:two-component system alkaline phosphatase synthesis response regulator PhoP
MIVEDEPETAEMFAEMMRLSGYRVIKTMGGASAINLLMQEIPDALVLDLMMPDVSGIQVLRFVRGDSKLEHVPVVVVSAKSMPVDITLGMEAGASKYLTKPVAFLELKKAIDEVINQSME